MNNILSKSVPSLEGLEADKKAAVRFEDCAVGNKAIYLKYMMLPRLGCVPFDAVKRVFKRVAMSKGGYTGKGMFASIAYVVVVYDDDREVKCPFRREEEADRMIAYIHSHHPELPTVSAKYEAEYKQQMAYKEAFCYPELTPGQKEELARMKPAKEYLEKAGDLTERLEKAAREKYYSGKTAAKAKKRAKLAEEEYVKAVAAMEKYIEGYGSGFPVLARYAHPIVIERVCEVIRLDRAAEHEAAFRIVKEDLKKLNKDVFVSQEEYDQVVAIKPLFLAADYK